MTESDFSNVLDIIKRDILTCTLCTKAFGLKNKDHLPICLDCSHTFCFACLTRVRLGMGIFSTIRCPTCGVETTAGVSGVDGLNRNETTISLINIMDSHDSNSPRSTKNISNASDTGTPPASPSRSLIHSPSAEDCPPHTWQNLQSDVVENEVITIAQYHRLVADEKVHRIASRAGCRVSLSIPHLSLFTDSPPGVAIITFRGNPMQIRDGRHLFRKFLRDIRPHSFSSKHGPGQTLDALNPQGSIHTNETGDEIPLKYYTRQSQSFTGRAVSLSSPPSAAAAAAAAADREGGPVPGQLLRTKLPCNFLSVGNLLGSEGSRVQELAVLTGCQLEASPLDSPPEERDGDGKGEHFAVEVVGTYEGISVAVPLVKMVMARGESAMLKVREFYGSRGESSGSKGRSDDLLGPLPPPPGLDVPSSSPYPHGKQSTGSLRVKVRREGVRLSPPPGGLGESLEKERKSQVEGRAAEGSRGLEVVAEGTGEEHRVGQERGGGDGAVGECRFSDSDDEGGEGDDSASHVSSRSGGSSKGLPYTLSPSSSLPSASFPDYFIQPRVNKHSEVLVLGREEAEAYFGRDGRPTALGTEVMVKSHCDLERLQHPHLPPSTTFGSPGRQEQPSASVNVRITGEAVDREKAKYLLGGRPRGGEMSPSRRGASSAAVQRGGAGTSYREQGQGQGHSLVHHTEECVSRYVDCPVHFIPVLIGTGGYTIEDIQCRTATKILINDHIDEDQPPQICIIGTAAGVEEALACIERLLVNHRFKYRQRPFSPSQRTRSLPTATATSFSSSPPPSHSGVTDAIGSGGDLDTGRDGGRYRTTEPPTGSLQPNLHPQHQQHKTQQQQQQHQQQHQQQQHHQQQHHQQQQPQQQQPQHQQPQHQQEQQHHRPQQQDHKQQYHQGQPQHYQEQQRVQYIKKQPLQQHQVHHQPHMQQHPHQHQQQKQQIYQTQHQQLQNQPRQQQPDPSAPQEVPGGSGQDAAGSGSHVSSQLLCPSDKVSQLIGKKGSILRELKKMTQCEISIERSATLSPPAPLSPGVSAPTISSGPQLVHVSGLPGDVQAALQLVREVIELGPVVALKMQTIKMVIPLDKVPLVIGQRGITAKEMMRRSGCKIHVDEAGDSADTSFIELTGTAEQVGGAQELISHVLEHGTRALGKRFQK